MFLDHFGLREQPFGVTPDPHFLYFSSSHLEALAFPVLWDSERAGIYGPHRKAGNGQNHSTLSPFGALAKVRAHRLFVSKVQ